jgi:hypothetical protein
MIFMRYKVGAETNEVIQVGNFWLVSEQPAP